MHKIIHTATVVLALGAGAALPGAASALSLSDSPPLLNGNTKARVLYTVPHATTSIGQSVAFCVACTSTEKTDGKSFLVGVEIFDDGLQLENDVTAGEGVGSLDPGRTRIFCTQATDHFLGENIVTIAQLDQGSARVLSERTNVICAAYSLDPSGSAPAHFSTLPMFKGTRQRGD